MSRRIAKSFVIICGGLLSFVVVLWGVSLLAQTKSRSPLPAYFKDVITKKQEATIRGIQVKYDSQLDKLEAQIKDLRSQREAEMFAILTTAQKQRILELREEAKERLEANKKAKESAKNKTPAKKPGE